MCTNVQKDNGISLVEFLHYESTLDNTEKLPSLQETIIERDKPSRDATGPLKQNTNNTHEISASTITSTSTLTSSIRMQDLANEQFDCVQKSNPTIKSTGNLTSRRTKQSNLKIQDGLESSQHDKQIAYDTFKPLSITSSAIPLPEHALRFAEKDIRHNQSIKGYSPSCHDWFLIHAVLEDFSNEMTYGEREIMKHSTDSSINLSRTDRDTVEAIVIDIKNRISSTSNITSNYKNESNAPRVIIRVPSWNAKDSHTTLTSSLNNSDYNYSSEGPRPPTESVIEEKHNAIGNSNLETINSSETVSSKGDGVTYGMKTGSEKTFIIKARGDSKTGSSKITSKGSISTDNRGNNKKKTNSGQQLNRCLKRAIKSLSSHTYTSNTRRITHPPVADLSYGKTD